MALKWHEAAVDFVDRKTLHSGPHYRTPASTAPEYQADAQIAEIARRSFPGSASERSFQGAAPRAAFVHWRRLRGLALEYEGIRSQGHAKACLR